MEMRPFAADLPHQHNNGCETCNARGKLRDCDIPNEDIVGIDDPGSSSAQTREPPPYVYLHARRTASIGGTRGRAI
jgi:hypothetical protein